MSEVQFKTGPYGMSTFFIEENGEQLGFLDVQIKGNILKAIHTEVLEPGKGKGIGAKLVAAMVEYARSHNLKVVPICPYVTTVFNRHPEQYADIWER